LAGQFSSFLFEEMDREALRAIEPGNSREDSGIIFCSGSADL
jgi:hypothetical protein